jgi:hypothetical protein
MTLLQLKRVTVKGFMPWNHGFDVAAAIAEEDMFHFTAVFPGLGKEYVHMLPKLSLMISIGLEVPNIMA